MDKSTRKFVELESHIDGNLVNPFREKSHEEMDKLIEDFMRETDIERFWSTHFRKGAFLAQSSLAFEHARKDNLELDPEEDLLVKREQDYKWNQPFIVYALVA